MWFPFRHMMTGMTKRSDEVTEKNRIRIEQLFDRVLNRGELDFLDQVIAYTYIDHNLPAGTPSGRNGVRVKVEALRQAFPDIRFHREEILAEAEMVAARYHWTSTHKGAFGDLPPTGRQVDVGGMDFYRLQKRPNH